MIPEYDKLKPYFAAICDPHCFKRQRDAHCPYLDICEKSYSGENEKECTVKFETAIIKRYHEIHG